MQVSIVILNYNHPEVIDVCLRTLNKTRFADFEVIVVDNGSEQSTVGRLRELADRRLIDKLVLEQKNHMFVGNNIGVAHADPDTEFVLLLNSDVAFLREDWLSKALAWADGTIEYQPSVWGFHPTQPKPGPRDIVSIGYSHDAAVEPSHVRPEGWCCMIRRSVWTDISEDFPWHYGLEEVLANAVRNGAKCGVLSQYGTYVVHREGASGTRHMRHIENRRTPDIPGWFKGLDIETLDFTLGPHEHDSYLWW